MSQDSPVQGRLSRVQPRPLPAHPPCDHCSKATPLAIYCCFECMGLFCVECVRFHPTGVDPLRATRVLCTRCENEGSLLEAL